MSAAIQAFAMIATLLAGSTAASSASDIQTTEIAARQNITYTTEDTLFSIEDLVFGSASQGGEFKEEGNKLTVAGEVLFAPNATNLSDNADAEISRVVAEIERRSSVKITVTGHTDNVQGKKHNQQLSEKRASAVKDALSRELGDAVNIISHGKGQDEPVAENSTEQGRSLNRRVEVTITG